MSRKPLPFQFRLMNIIMLTVLLPFLLINWFSFSIIKSQMLADATSWLTGITENSGETMESYIKLLNGISKNPEFDVTLMKIFEEHRLKSEGMYGYSYEELSQINGWLSMLTEMDKSVVAVNFVDEAGNVFHLGKDVTVGDSGWLKKTEAVKGASIVWPPVKMDEGTFAFSISRKIINPTTFHNTAMIQIFFRLDFLTAERNDLLMRDGDFIIMDQNNKVVFEQKEQSIGNSMLWDSPDQVKVTYNSNLTGWKLIGVVPKNVLFHKIDRIQRWLYLINGVFILITMIIVFWFSSKLTNPLRKLSKLMQNAAKSNFDVDAIPVKRDDEIGYISKSFNQMIDRIHCLIHDVTETEKKRKRSDIAALQSQINPHFLYNTLSTIAMQAEVDGNYKVLDMASQLGRLLRYTIGSYQDWVDLTQECDHLAIYCRVMQFRYPFIEFELQLDDQVKDWPVIRLLLQPLVENAILHGIVPKGSDGRVKVTIKKSMDEYDLERLVIEVEDCGIGINQAGVEAIYAHLKGTSSHDNAEFGIGLKNVYDRILLSWGGKCTFNLDSEVGIGTKIRIELPRRLADENHGSGG